MNCPLEGEVAPERCGTCCASLKHVPCPVDLYNPTFVEICLGTTIEELKKEHPEWEGVLLE